MKGIKDTSSKTYRELMGNGLTYIVPKFQRDYTWENDHWDDLWQDIIALSRDEEVEHYMGYLVLQTEDNKSFDVIDGQQRLTTLSIIILVILKNIKKLEEAGIDQENNKIRRETLYNSYIGFLNPVTLIAENKLKLNRNNDDFYKMYLTTLRSLPQRGLNSSEKLMRNCFLWFDNVIIEHFPNGGDLAAFIDKIVDKIFFTVIKVSDELNAFTVFETLNSRGVRLSSADLLKNHLFSIVDKEGHHKNEIDELELLWSKVISKLGDEKFPEFLRIYWNSRNKTTRHNELFKTIRKNIKNKGEAFDLIRKLNDNADLYKALLNPNDEMWNENVEIKKYLTELKIFSIKQPISLLLSAYDCLDQNNFANLLKMCSVISFRYNVIGGLNPNDQETVYNYIALKILSERKYSKNDIKKIYPSDDAFENAFLNKTFKLNTRNHAIVRYIFGKIESVCLHNEIDFQSDRFSIEHILPENPGDDWEYIANEVWERSVYRLGNLSLLESGLNKECGNSSFNLKKDIYKKSSSIITRKISDDYNEWNEEKIAQRQSWLAKQAKSIWKIS
jgi:uncharacterized protein with ParB-like and HNH nuclease domain